MRGVLARVVRALAFLLLAVAPAQAQISRIVVDDLRQIEGTGGAYKVFVKVRLPDGPPTTADVTVDFALEPGLAIPLDDFTPRPPGTLTFMKGVDFEQVIDVEIIADNKDEWSITLQQDEMFFIQLSKPSANATLVKSRGTITLIDDDHRDAGVQYLSAVTDATAAGGSDGRNRLQWRVPAASEGQSVKNFEVCWNIASPCTPPDTPAEAQKCDPLLTPLAPGEKQLFTHTALDVPQNYCYSVFTYYVVPGSPSLERGEVVTRTFDSITTPVQWSFTPGSYGGGARGISVVPPSVGFDGVFSVGTDGVVYSMERNGPDGGLWPKDFFPLALGKGAHNRNPVVPLPEGSRFFVGTESGEVHSVDAKSGAVVWSRAALFPPGSQQLMTSSTGTQAVPAGVFEAFGGQNDVLVVGTATAAGNTTFFELDPATGANLDTFGPADAPPGPIDNVFGMAVVDYADNKVYFGTNGSALTLWGLDLGPPGTPDLKLAPLPWNPQSLGGSLGTDGAPVMRNGRLYLGTETGAAATVYSLRVSDGNLYKFTHGDGQVKGFVWPDRRDDRIYFTTDHLVFGMKDDGTALTPLWSPINLGSPSIPLQWPGTDFLYVGDGNGNLVEIDVKTGTVIKSIKLSALDVQIGAPSLDNVNRLVHVGSAVAGGVIYAVRVPF
jgi:outer membrane protein assembly factor BamB